MDKIPTRLSLMILFGLFIAFQLQAQDLLKENSADSELDKKVKSFLRAQQGKWHDLNIPVSDGELLYKIIVEHKYTQGLEIGTSTGHSAIWIAWAMSKTGGKLVTIEIDESRKSTAMENFKKAGLMDYIDA